MLNMYMGYSRGAGQQEGACLIFAHTGKEAKNIGYPTICEWFDGGFIDMAVKRLNAPHLMAEADAKKMETGIPHVVECPTTCPVCKTWGGAPLKDGRQGCDCCGGDD